MSGVAGRSGRPRSIGTINREIEVYLDSIIMSAYTVIGDKIRAGSLDAAVYAIDRRFGKPKQQIDQRTKIELSLSAEDIELATRLAVQSQRRLLDVVDSTATELPLIDDEGTSEVIDEV